MVMPSSLCLRVVSRCCCSGSSSCPTQPMWVKASRVGLTDALPTPLPKYAQAEPLSRGQQLLQIAGLAPLWACRSDPHGLVMSLKVTIAYPDEGAHKRFHTSFKAEGYPEVICTKVCARVAGGEEIGGNEEACVTDHAHRNSGRGRVTTCLR